MGFLWFQGFHDRTGLGETLGFRVEGFYGYPIHSFLVCCHTTFATCNVYLVMPKLANVEIH